MSTTTSTYALVKHARGDTPWDVEVNADLDTIDAEIARPRLPFNSPTVGATTTCDLALARVFVFTVSQAMTLAFTNVPSSSFAVRVRLLITNGSAFVLTFPASVTWITGGPSLKASGVDEVEMLTKDGGTTWYATLRRFGGVIYQSGRVSTTSTVDASVAAYVLPANSLGINGQSVRITASGTENGAQVGTVHVKFGATDLVNQAMNAGGGAFSYQATVTRITATSQCFIGLLWYVNPTTPALVSTGSLSVPNETLTNAITIDFRGTTANAGSPFFYTDAVVELLS